MELYFKDVEALPGETGEALNCCADGTAEETGDTAENLASAELAELAERVSAARSVY